MTDNFEARQIVDAVTRRERRRIRTLAFLTVGLWVWALFFVPALFLPMAAKIKFYLLQQQGNDAAALAGHPPIDLPRLIHDGTIVTMMIGGVVLLRERLASICTVALALTIRRVTLRQLSQGLAEISEQLRQLQRSGP